MNWRWRPFFISPAYMMALATALSAMFALQDYTTFRLEGVPVSFPRQFLGHSIDSLLWTAVIFLIWEMIPFLPIDKKQWKLTLVKHAAICLIISVCEMSAFIFLARSMGLGKRGLSFGDHFLRITNTAMASNVIVYFASVAMLTGAEYYKRFNKAELEKLSLESALSNAQLLALRAQLNPHFMFNTLNSVSALMRKDVEAADRAIESFSALLRMTLENDQVYEISLQEELEFIQEYLNLQKIRFGDSLLVTIDVDGGVRSSRVPSMLLQPIVENAVVHGTSRNLRVSEILIRVDRVHNSLRIVVENDGPPIDGDVLKGPGLGISNTIARLEALYGSESFFAIQSIPRGVKVEVRLPDIPITLGVRNGN